MADLKAAVYAFKASDQFGNTIKLNWDIQVPAALIADPASNPDLFKATAYKLSMEKHPEALAKQKFVCVACNKAAATDFCSQPMSYLHLPEPRIIAMGYPQCERKACRDEVLMNSQMMMGSTVGSGVPNGGVLRDPTKMMAAAVGEAMGEATCSNAACMKPGAKFCCSRCRQSWYCNRDCQKAAWKAHKKECKASVAAAPQG